MKTMKMAMNQPYFFPYIGYFQLVASVEKFVFCDDFNFIKNGWINRNRVLIDGKVRYITVPLCGASAFKKINEVIIDNKPYSSTKILESLRHSYSKAPYFKPVSDLLLQTFSGDEYLVSELAKKSVVNVAQYIGLKTEFVATSSIYNNSELRGTERVLDVCRKEQVDVYYNLPNGKNLYDEKRFRDNGVNVRFIIPNLREYPQFLRSFHPGLSIIDVLMFNSKESTLKMLEFKNT